MQTAYKDITFEGRTRTYKILDNMKWFLMPVLIPPGCVILVFIGYMKLAKWISEKVSERTG